MTQPTHCHWSPGRPTPASPPLHESGEGVGGEAPRLEALFAAYQAEANDLLRRRAAAYAAANETVYRLYDVGPDDVAAIRGQIDVAPRGTDLR